tara:strand:- start:99 stop:674 length:576 start_codon:yes stop_codon:yes gene_type:complete
MTPTKSSNFRRIAEGLDVKPLLQLLDAKPELWKEIEARQKFTNSPHKDTETIYVRGPLKMSQYYVLWDTGSYDYPCMEYLKPALVPLMRPILEQLGVEDMGRVLIVNLKPCGHVTKHIDQGTYADHYQRFHLVLRSNQHCFQTSGSELQRFEVGDVWYMNNKQLHTAHNVGDTERIHIIFDCVPIVEELQC